MDERTSKRPTRVAIRVMGVWVRRADALVQAGTMSNAARAVDDLHGDQQRGAAGLSLAAAPCP